MLLVVKTTQTLTRDVGIDLGGGERGMTEHHLHRPQISTVFYQVGGEGRSAERYAG